MGMEYIVSSKYSPTGVSRRKVHCNSTAAVYINSLILQALEPEYTDLYEKIMDMDVLDYAHFDTLSVDEFKLVVNRIRAIVAQSAFYQSLKLGRKMDTGPGVLEEQTEEQFLNVAAKIWIERLEPLIAVDERWGAENGAMPYCPTEEWQYAD